MKLAYVSILAAVVSFASSVSGTCDSIGGDYFVSAPDCASAVTESTPQCIVTYDNNLNGCQVSATECGCLFTKADGTQASLTVGGTCPSACPGSSSVVTSSVTSGGTTAATTVTTGAATVTSGGTNAASTLTTVTTGAATVSNAVTNAATSDAITMSSWMMKTVAVLIAAVVGL